MSAPDAFRDEESRQREFGLALVTRFHGLLRAARLYDAGNRSYQQQLEELLTTLSQGAEGDEVTLVSMGDYFYVDGLRLRARAGQIGLFRSLREEFDSRGLGALRFLPGLGAEEVVTLVRVLLATRDPVQGERLPEELAEAGVLRVVAVRARDIRSVSPESEDDGEELSDERARARQVFGRAVRGTRGAILRAAHTGRPAMRQVRRVVQPIVDSILKDEYSIVGLTAIKAHDEYTFVHCVNVSVLSVAIGTALGLPRASLATLGVAALLHDLGKLAVPPEVLHKPGKLSPEEWAQVEAHPLAGVRMVASMPGLSGLLIDTMRVCHEHHLNVDGTGYPRTAAGTPTSTLSRIVAVADVFDALTAHRAYRRRPFSGHEALAIMLGPERGHSDPAVLWAMVQSVGLYPAGTVMRTRSGHTVLSRSPNPKDMHRPFCTVLAGPGDRMIDPASEVRWDPMPDDEQVVEVLPSETHGMPVDQMLAA